MYNINGSNNVQSVGMLQARMFSPTGEISFSSGGSQLLTDTLMVVTSETSLAIPFFSTTFVADVLVLLVAWRTSSEGLFATAGDFNVVVVVFVVVVRVAGYKLEVKILV